MDQGPEVPQLDDAERAFYEWQMWIGDVGEAGQRRLKAASVLVSRCGGVGGAAALYLAAAGVGKLVLAHAGDLRPSDPHRQVLMPHDGIGRPRIDAAVRRLREVNPHILVEGVPENITEANARALVERVDLVLDAAPLFEERLRMNREAVRQHKPMIECAMYELEGRVTTIIPGRTPCLACLHPTAPPAWKRQFPVLGAVAGAIGCLGAVEAIKVITGIGEPLLGRLLICDLRRMAFCTVRIARNPQCPVCGTAISPETARQLR
jgi:molybdopterin-synthase adenylyltransferase